MRRATGTSRDQVADSCTRDERIAPAFGSVRAGTAKRDERPHGPSIRAECLNVRQTRLTALQISHHLTVCRRAEQKGSGLPKIRGLGMEQRNTDSNHY